jgi:hypothetical protein
MKGETENHPRYLASRHLPLAIGGREPGGGFSALPRVGRSPWGYTSKPGRRKTADGLKSPTAMPTSSGATHHDHCCDELTELGVFAHGPASSAVGAHALKLDVPVHDEVGIVMAAGNGR